MARHPTRRYAMKASSNRGDRLMRALHAHTFNAERGGSDVMFSETVELSSATPPSSKGRSRTCWPTSRPFTQPERPMR
jgi:hypothetical protein